MPGSGPSIAARHVGPALSLHQLGPAPVKLPMIALTHTKIACPSFEALIETLVAQSHLGVHCQTACDGTAAGLGAFLPIVHVVLLERAGRAEAAYSRQPGRLPHRGRRGLVDKHP